jgi:hypothetical protein
MKYEVRGTKAAELFDVNGANVVTRSWVTRVLVGTFCLLLIGSAVVSYYTAELSYFKDTASIIGIPLGMIIQYYFGYSRGARSSGIS